MGRFGRKSAVPESSSGSDLDASEDSESESIDEKIVSKQMNEHKERHPSLEDFLNKKPTIYQRIDRNDGEARVDQTFEMLYDALQVNYFIDCKLQSVILGLFYILAS